MARVVIPHPLWIALVAAERAWSTDKEQAESRARSIIFALQQQGLVATPGYWIGGFFAQGQAPA